MHHNTISVNNSSSSQNHFISSIQGSRLFYSSHTQLCKKNKAEVSTINNYPSLSSYIICLNREETLSWTCCFYNHLLFTQSCCVRNHSLHHYFILYYIVNATCGSTHSFTKHVQALLCIVYNNSHVMSPGKKNVLLVWTKPQRCIDHRCTTPKKTNDNSVWICVCPGKQHISMCET